MCVPESEYHGYVKRRKSNTQIEREVLESVVAKRFDLRKGRYGYRRIGREFGRDGIVVSEKRALAVMRKLTNGKGRARKQSGARSNTSNFTTTSGGCAQQSTITPHAI